MTGFSKFNLIGDIDANFAAIEYAKELSKDYSELSLKAIDIFSEDFKKQSYDIVLCTLFLHHFKSNELILFLKTTIQKVTIGIVVNDLHRHKVAYYLFKFIGFFVKNKMIREDGLTSVLRAFKKKELDAILNKISPIINAYMEKKSVKILLDSKNILIGRSNLNLTNEVIKEINEKIK